jgi:hypothetical protein
MTRHPHDPENVPPGADMPRAPRPLRAETSTNVDQGGGHEVDLDEVDHAMVLAEHHCAT